METNFMQALSKSQVRRMNVQILAWVEKTLKGDNGVYLYNILNDLKCIYPGSSADRATRF